MYWGGKSGLPSLCHLWTWMYKTHDYFVLSPAFFWLWNQSNLTLLQQLRALKPYGEGSGRLQCFSEDLPSLQSPGLECHSIRSLPRSEMCLSFAHMSLLCPGDELKAFFPPYSSTKAVCWIGDVPAVRLCGCTCAGRVWWDELKSLHQLWCSNELWVVLASAGCSREEHVPFSLRRIGFGTLLASRKETLYVWLSVLGWLIFDNFIWMRFAELVNIEFKTNYEWKIKG